MFFSFYLFIEKNKITKMFLLDYNSEIKPLSKQKIISGNCQQKNICNGTLCDNVSLIQPKLDYILL